MIFVLIEKVMNGTFTQRIFSYGIDAPSFKEAVNKVKTKMDCMSSSFQITTDDSKEFSYYIPGQFNVIGKMFSVPLQMI